MAFPFWEYDYQRSNCLFAVNTRRDEMESKTIKTPNWTAVQIIVDGGKTYQRHICSRCTINCEKIIPLDDEITHCINPKKNQEDSDEDE
jgi:hypothetical protein